MAQESEITGEAFEVLRTAVTISKERQIASVKRLRIDLEQIFPGRMSDIDSALRYWGNYISSKNTICSLG